ncbi:glycosyl transferase [Allostella vacuolata]|nr:glycosyl transferase [Stella vacuolata]
MSGLLFITSTRIGDTVLSTGVLDQFMQMLPRAPVTVACGPAAAPLFLHLPRLERVHAMAKRRRGGHWLDLWRATVGRRWDAVIDLRGSAIGWLLSARRRFVRRRWRLEDSRHRVVELGAAFGFAPPPAPRLWIGEAERALALRLLPPGGPILAIGPTANWAGKEWRADRFATLARDLTAPGGPLPGARIAIIAAGSERERARPVLEALPPERRVDLVGHSLLEAAACLERASLFIGNDTGLMHISAATGTPTLGLFGPSDARHYAPWGPRCAFVRTPQSHAELTGGPGFDHRTTGTLMDGLAPATVAAAARALLEREGRER